MVKCPDCGAEVPNNGSCFACYVCGFETCNINGLEVAKGVRESNSGDTET